MLLKFLDLLPQKNNFSLKDRRSKLQVIKLLLVIYKHAIAAIESFIDKKLYLFDAHVGETLCQIRAYKNLLLSSEIQNDLNKTILNKELLFIKSCNRELVNFYDKVNEAMKSHKDSYYRFLDCPIKIIDFFCENNFMECLSDDVAYLIQCYILSIYSLKDIEGNPYAINFSKIKKDMDISKTQAKTLVNLYQRRISEYSCEFVLKLANYPIIDSAAKEALPQLKKIAEEGREALPVFLVTEILLKHLLYNKNSILIIVNRYLKMNFIDTVKIFFSASNDGNYFYYREAILEDYDDHSCFVIKGEVVYLNIDQAMTQSEYIKNFIKLGVLNAVLYNMAAHPQYTGEKLKRLSENPYLELININIDAKTTHEALLTLQERLLMARSLAKEHGCCLNNKGSFFLKHIFCDMLSKHIEFTEPVNNVLKYNQHKVFNREELVV